MRPDQNGGMASTSDHHDIRADAGVKLLVIGVAIVLTAQFLPVVPIAGAMAIVAWGTVLTVSQNRKCLLLAAAVYAVLGILAVSSQVDLAIRSPSLAWGMLAALDGAAAVVLLYSLVRQVGEMVAGAVRY